MRGGVKPGRASGHHADVELTALEIHAVNVGDFKFAAFRRLETRGNFDDLTIVKIKSGNGVTGFRLLRFLFNAERLPVRIELDDAITLGVIDGVRKNAAALGLERGGAQFLDEVVSVENVVAEHKPATAQADNFLPNHKVLADASGLCL